MIALGILSGQHIQLRIDVVRPQQVFIPHSLIMYFNILANRNAGLRDETDTD